MATIIVIDDSLSVRTQLREVLLAAGHEVIEGSDGMEGLDKILNTPNVDLVISDYKMPGCDGISMLEQAKEKLGTFKFPVFMLTTETSERLKGIGRNLGVIAWIIKPFVEDKILNAINKVMAMKKT